MQEKKKAAEKQTLNSLTLARLTSSATSGNCGTVLAHRAEFNRCGRRGYDYDPGLSHALCESHRDEREEKEKHHRLA